MLHASFSLTSYRPVLRLVMWPWLGGGNAVLRNFQLGKEVHYKNIERVNGYGGDMQQYLPFFQFIPLFSQKPALAHSHLREKTESLLYKMSHIRLCREAVLTVVGQISNILGLVHKSQEHTWRQVNWRVADKKLVGFTEPPRASSLPMPQFSFNFKIKNYSPQKRFFSLRL